jgi:hypothetical protein
MMTRLRSTPVSKIGAFSGATTARIGIGANGIEKRDEGIGDVDSKLEQISENMS